jgi:hypothetical protein
MSKILLVPEILDVNQVWEYLGKNIGIKMVRKLMNDNVIISAYFSRKLVAKKSSVDDFIETVFTSGYNIMEYPIVPIERFNNSWDKHSRKKKNAV